MMKISDRAAEKFKEVAANCEDPEKLRIRLYMGSAG
jgi:Fe-S cluster assembly iron-binding protein IscA